MNSQITIINNPCIAGVLERSSLQGALGAVKLNEKEQSNIGEAIKNFKTFSLGDRIKLCKLNRQVKTGAIQHINQFQNILKKLGIVNVHSNDIPNKMGFQAINDDGQNKIWDNQHLGRGRWVPMKSGGEVDQTGLAIQERRTNILTGGIKSLQQEIEKLSNVTKRQKITLQHFNVALTNQLQAINSGRIGIAQDALAKIALSKNLPESIKQSIANVLEKCANVNENSISALKSKIENNFTNRGTIDDYQTAIGNLLTTVIKNINGQNKAEVTKEFGLLIGKLSEKSNLSTDDSLKGKIMNYEQNKKAASEVKNSLTKMALKFPEIENDIVKFSEDFNKNHDKLDKLGIKMANNKTLPPSLDEGELKVPINNVYTPIKECADKPGQYEIDKKALEFQKVRAGVLSNMIETFIPDSRTISQQGDKNQLLHFEDHIAKGVFNELSNENFVQNPEYKSFFKGLKDKNETMKSVFNAFENYKNQDSDNINGFIEKLKGKILDNNAETDIDHNVSKIGASVGVKIYDETPQTILKDLESPNANVGVLLAKLAVLDPETKDDIMNFLNDKKSDDEIGGSKTQVIPGKGPSQWDSVSNQWMKVKSDGNDGWKLDIKGEVLDTVNQLKEILGEQPLLVSMGELLNDPSNKLDKEIFNTIHKELSNLSLIANDVNTTQKVNDLLEVLNKKGKVAF